MKNRKTGKIAKVVFTIVLVFAMATVTLASAYTDQKENFHKYYTKIYKEPYNKFLKSIGVKDYKDPNSGWSVIREKNKKLIIGASGVVYCGAITDGIDFGYDIVGFGGVTDDMIREWIPKIKKKYDKIIYYGCTNTINLCCSLPDNNFQFLEAQSDIFETIIELYKLLKGGTSELVIVEVKEIKNANGTNDLNNLYINKFNNYAKILNMFFKTRGFKTYEIPFDPSLQNSNDGGHFSNLDVYKDLLK